MSVEKEVSYTANNSYSTLNTLTSKTKNVWIVCHGLGYLSKYFIKYFKDLNTDENYIIAPQAPAKHYLKNEYKHVGATWLTKDNTQQNIPTVLNYLDSVLEAEKIPNDKHIIIFGFSQGVSIASRWISQRKIRCNTLVLYAGKLPREFTKDNFKQVNNTVLIVGDKDPYVTPETVSLEKKYAAELFGNTVEFISFNGVHEVKPLLLLDIVR